MKCDVKRCNNEAEIHASYPAENTEYNLCRECWEKEDFVMPGDPTLYKYWQRGAKIRPLEIVAR